MAGPPIRRPSTKPPPLPARAPIPSPKRTDVVQAQVDPSEEVSEITKNFEAPDAGQLVQHMLALVASEAEALLTGDDSDGRLADLNVRTALASWDGLREPEEAMRYLELAENHPLAPRLHLSAALGQRAPEPLAIVQARVAGLPASTIKSALSIERPGRRSGTRSGTWSRRWSWSVTTSMTTASSRSCWRRRSATWSEIQVIASWV